MFLILSIFQGFLFKLKRAVALFLFFSILLFPKFLLAQNVWVKPTQASFEEFKAYMQALGVPHISYAQKQLERKRRQAQSFQLKKKLIPAQELYLSGEGERAIKAFNHIASSSLLADWEEEDWRIILYSFLRMAQSEEDPEKRKALLLSANAFSLSPINSVNYPDHYLFPPPLMEELDQLQKKANTLFVDWEKIFPHHEIILVNGQKMPRGKKAKISQALYRVTALSSSHKPWSKIVNLSSLLTQQIKTKSLTKGPCHNLKIWQDKPGLLKLFQPLNCPEPETLRFEKAKKEPEEHKKLIKQGKGRISGKHKSFLSSSDLKSAFSKKRRKSNNQPKPYQGKKELKNLQFAHFKKDDFYEMDSSLLNSEGFKSHFEEPAQQPDRLWDIPPWLIVGAGVVAFSLIVSLSQIEEKKTTIYIY